MQAAAEGSQAGEARKTKEQDRRHTLMEFGLPVAPLPSETSVTVERSTMPRGLEEELTSLLAKRNRKPCSRRRGRGQEAWGWQGGAGRAGRAGRAGSRG